MTAQSCIAEIKRAAGRDLSDDELIDLTEELQKRIRQRQTLATGEALEDTVRKAADDYARDMDIAAKVEKRNAAINLRRRLEAVDKVRSTFAGNEALGLESLLVGVNHAAKGSRLSVATEQSQLKGHYLGAFYSEMEIAGLWKPFVSGALDREIAQALWAINRAEPLPSAVPREAHRMAEIIAKWQEVARQDANAAGAWIGKIEGFITRQSHDTFKIRRAGYEAWKAEILPRLDLERTLDGSRDVDDFLNGVFQGLASGIHLKAPTGEPSGFKGPRNIAKKASAERVLHFKDADAWTDYNARFGTGALRESVIRSLETSAQNTGLMRVLGTNPEANFAAIADELQRGIADPAARSDFAATVKGKLTNQLRVVDGSANIPVNHTMARWSSGIRAGENMAKLGFSLFSQFSDLSAFASELRYQGSGGYLSNVGEGITAILRGRGGHERKELGGMLGIISDSMANSAITRFSPGEDGAPGMMTKLQGLFFKLNGMQFWTDRLRRGSYEALSHRLALNADRRFGNLDPDLQRVLGMFAIDERAWRVIRQARRKEIDGRAFIVPEEIEKLPDAPFDVLLKEQGVKATPKRIADLKRELADKVRSYLVDRADHMTLVPDARTRATLLRGTKPGTVEGEFFRFATQLKSFTAAFMQKVIGREIYGRGARPNAGLIEALRNGNGEMLGFAQLILWTTGFGYASLVVTDLLKGREPRNPLDPKTWAAAMVKGGGVGIYADLLFGETRKQHGRSLVTNTLGPSFAIVDDLADLWGRLREGDDTAAATFKFAISNTPFANIFYFKVALDYLILHQITEAMNPGYLKRMEKRVTKETGQEWLVRPSQNYVRW